MSSVKDWENKIKSQTKLIERKISEEEEEEEEEEVKTKVFSYHKDTLHCLVQLL